MINDEYSSTPSAALPPPKLRMDVQQRFDKTTRASEGPTDFGLIQTVYPNAIAFGGEGASELRGISQFFAVLTGTMGMFGVCWGYRALNDIDLMSNASWLFMIFEWFFILFGGLTFLVCFVYAYFSTFFLPGDSSVIFDRGHGKVYLIDLQLAKLTRRAAWGAPPLEVRSIDWSLISAEHRVVCRAAR